MIFTSVPLQGARVIDMEKHSDERGYFARSWCTREFSEQHLDANIVQCSVSFNHVKGTLRGMHFQEPPHGETKLVRCSRGAIYDVIVDLRPASATFLKWFGIELTEDKGTMLYIPKGCAHGFQTLVDKSEVFYQMADFYVPGAARGVRWNDPLFGISWPLDVTTISQRDQQYPDAAPGQFETLRGE